MTTGPRVLLVEDEASLQALYDAQLKAEGYEVELLDTGEEVLERLKHAPTPDIMVLDIKLAGIDGIEVMRRALQIDPNLPIILHSAYPDYKGRFSTWCADAYVVKSSDMTELKTTIVEVLKRRESEA